MKQDWDTQEQCDCFDEFLEDTSDSRRYSLFGNLGYNDLEWEAFQHGWNAAKKHFGVTE